MISRQGGIAPSAATALKIRWNGSEVGHKSLLSRLLVKHRLWSKVDPVAIGESQAFDTCALIDDPVEALSILDDPGVVLIANVCVQTRNPLIGHTHIGALKCHHRSRQKRCLQEWGS